MEYGYIFALVTLLGLVVGSFLNAVIYRLPRDKKVSRGRSICPHCTNNLKWYHNIPIFSYIFLGGKCGYCKKKISFRYPLVEIINTIAYSYFFWRYGLSWEFAQFAYISSALLIIFFIDLDFQIIPDTISLSGIVIGLLCSLLPGGVTVLESFIGLLVGGGSLYLVAVLGDWLFKKESMGGGDIKLAAMLGAFVGWQKVLFIFLASALIGLIVSIIIMIFSKQLREERVVPFGPFIAVAAILAITYGDTIIDFYVSNFLK